MLPTIAPTIESAMPRLLAPAWPPPAALATNSMISPKSARPSKHEDGLPRSTPRPSSTGISQANSAAQPAMNQLPGSVTQRRQPRDAAREHESNTAQR